MHLVTLTPTRLFDVHRVPSSRFGSQHTLFGFESAGLKKPYVRVSGWPRLEVGDTLVVLLSQEGNWQSLLGWKNKTTGEEVGPSVAGAIWWFVLALLFTLPFLYFLTDSVPGHPLWSPFWALAGSFTAAMHFAALVRGLKVKRWLQTMQ
jgi:hypothetical protein